MDLYLITARGGSKRIPGKNLRLLGGRPLLAYTAQAALEARRADDLVWLSTDDAAIAELGKSLGLEVPFLRPAELASDTAGSREVVLHALEVAEQMGQNIHRIILLQPTSPFRTAAHLREALEYFGTATDMVVGVTESHANPYFNLFEENKDGWLLPSKKSAATRYQDCPKAYLYNGAVYVIRPESLKKWTFRELPHITKYIMDARSSVDVDTPDDWAYAEFLIRKQ